MQINEIKYIENHVHYYAMIIKNTNLIYFIKNNNII